jgi:hypothetical protein
MEQSKYEEIVGNFKRKAGKLISQTYPHYGYDVYHPKTADDLTGYLEEAIKEVEKYYGKNLS